MLFFLVQKLLYLSYRKNFWGRYISQKTSQMDDFITYCLRERYEKRYKTYNFTSLGLKMFISLPRRSQELFHDMLDKLSCGHGDGCIIVEGDHEDFGFSDRSNFYRYRRKLERSYLIYAGRNNRYFINPTLVNYLTVQQLNKLYHRYGIKEKYEVNFGLNQK